MIQDKVAHYIKQENLLCKEDKILIALSGGADSIALLHLLLTMGYNCEAAHCNFHLRGEESNQDMAFVEALCKKNNIHLHLIHFDTTKYASQQKLSIEMAARELRYNWFSDLQKTHGYTCIAVGHHQDDSIETILLNLVRGTGINGLLGIKPKNNSIVRPLLCLTRQEIISFLTEIKQPYVTDSTNLSDDYARNKVRLNVIPQLQAINPAAKQNILATAKHLGEAASIYNRYITERITQLQTPEGVRIAELLQEDFPHALLFEILYPLGFNDSQINDILTALSGQPGKQFISSKGWRAIKDREFLVLEQIVEKEKSDTPPFTLIYEKAAYDSSFVIPRNKDIACFDADKFQPPYTIRRWRKGDKFTPFGMKGKKLVSDFLTDRKLSIAQKENQWVLCSKDKIAWIIGERTDNSFRISPSTHEIILVKVKE
ncbi:tRNA lysidine(34) synthetase TilS [Bacteroides sp. 214]|uniref:tRNA lysidine(34) synthetase TilS n=1 Tax=Bacteroides sp. 214 TaxID=2302935 RepID=UPI0013CF899B|nr:tRNA lysidine(34) synthetase TilS [Bacteroides sp. 214]NDW11427.1 tRNA lysidine(34) synthetase TilS [Bacteroides sp. 214]